MRRHYVLEIFPKCGKIHPPSRRVPAESKMIGAGEIRFLKVPNKTYYQYGCHSELSEESRFRARLWLFAEPPLEHSEGLRVTI